MARSLQILFADRSEIVLEVRAEVQATACMHVKTDCSVVVSFVDVLEAGVLNATIFEKLNVAVVTNLQALLRLLLLQNEMGLFCQQVQLDPNCISRSYRLPVKKSKGSTQI